MYMHKFFEALETILSEGKSMSDDEIERDQADREKDEEDAEDEEEAKTGQAVEGRERRPSRPLDPDTLDDDDDKEDSEAQKAKAAQSNEGLYGPSRDATHSQAMKDVDDIGKKAKEKDKLKKPSDDDNTEKKEGKEYLPLHGGEGRDDLPDEKRAKELDTYLKKKDADKKGEDGEPKEEMAEPGKIDASKKNGDWIQKAVNPKHKGYCTPMTKSTCTPARKALAKRFKKAAKKEKSQGGTGWQGKV